ncbi:ROK family protein [Macrococcus sp. EM39E]|uniref:ROK family protein n=1 Tax=Macrococcus animalis TaxID=3395467 RepID=UPI0039BE9ACA
MENVIGIDIGGTKVAIGKFNIKGELLNETIIPFKSELSPEKMSDLIFDQIENLVDNNTKSLGFGVPGPLKLKEGKMGNPPNLKSWHNFNIIKYFSSKTQLPFYVENDANAAAVAEHLYNNQEELKNTIYITISTGIGSGIIINNHLLSGTNGNAGEIGHTSVDLNSNIKCDTCGQYGCLENLASGTAIASILSTKLNRTISTLEAFELYRNENKFAIEVIDKAISHIAQAIVTLINLYDTEQIVLGGGVMKNGDIILPKVIDYVSNHALSDVGKSVIIKKSKFENIGLLGAAALAINN